MRPMIELSMQSVSLDNSSANILMSAQHNGMRWFPWLSRKDWWIYHGLIAAQLLFTVFEFVVGNVFSGIFLIIVSVWIFFMLIERNAKCFRNAFLSLLGIKIWGP